MHRCAKPQCDPIEARRSAVAVALAAMTSAATLPWTAASLAQTLQRQFPANALRGEIAVGQPPSVLLNRKAARFAPGVRIRGTDNLLMTTGRLANLSGIVHYTFDRSGDIAEVWLLTPAELARAPWPATPEQAASWTFDPLAQTWTKP